MDKYSAGHLVYAKLGTLSVVGTVVYRDPKTGKYLIRFSNVQQNWYSEDELTPYKQDLDCKTYISKNAAP